jgi:hypothetical protein
VSFARSFQLLIRSGAASPLLYVAAILETDDARLADRISAAELAIANRMDVLNIDRRNAGGATVNHDCSSELGEATNRTASIAPLTGDSRVVTPLAGSFLIGPT